MSDKNYEKYKKQEQFCEERGLPMFAPYICWKCGEIIWEAISEEKASKEHITGCPYCLTSYCD